MMFRRLQDSGHRGILLNRWCNALVGDPSGRRHEKNDEQRNAINNVNEIKELASHFIKLDGENPAIIVDNKDWIGDGFIYRFFKRSWNSL